jgi:hypothetical protein
MDRKFPWSHSCLDVHSMAYMEGTEQKGVRRQDLKAGSGFCPDTRRGWPAKAGMWKPIVGLVLAVAKLEQIEEGAPTLWVYRIKLRECIYSEKIDFVTVFAFSMGASAPAGHNIASPLNVSIEIDLSYNIKLSVTWTPPFFLNE